VATVCLIMAVITVFAVRETPWKPTPVSVGAASNIQAGSTLDGRFWRDLGLTVLATLVIVGAALAILQVAPFGLRLNSDTLSVIELIGIAVGGGSLCVWLPPQAQSRF